VRLPSALCGLLSVFLIYLLAKQLWEKLELFQLFKKEKIEFLNRAIDLKEIFALSSSFFLAISSWSIMYSRAAFEANVAFFFIVLGAYFFFLSLEKTYFWIFSGLSFVLSLYTYHSPKIFVPLFLILSFFVFRKKLLKQIEFKNWYLSLYLLIFVSSFYWFFKDTFLSEGGARAGTLIFFENNQLISLDFHLIRQLFLNLIAHLNPLFYIWGSASNFRNQMLWYGLMPFWQYFLFIIGLVYLIKLGKKEIITFFVLWYLFGILPGVLSKPDVVPHAIRSFNILPSMIFISSLGLIFFLNYLTNKKQKMQKILLSLFIMVICLDLTRFTYEYFLQFPKYSARDWQYGYEKIALISQKYESQVDKILITSQYGQPYLMFAFYQERNPLYVIWGEMSKYLYVDKIEWDKDKFSKNTLLIGTDKEIPDEISEDLGKIIDRVYFPDGSVAFKIVKTNL
ncbi:hypothetical protein GYA19_00005, partial [Candidatus Beckwithbacteria bacterium]|nr:hypothetical protein [Candidatus Beckwithbacteria bacterium]